MSDVDAQKEQDVLKRLASENASLARQAAFDAGDLRLESAVPLLVEHFAKLPGVGRKSANLIMGDVFGKPAIVTDTHCIRLCNKIGLVDGIKEPQKVEMALWKIIPPEEGSDFCHRLVYHGREVCTARTHPYCEKCCISDICKKVGV